MNANTPLLPARSLHGASSLPLLSGDYLIALLPLILFSCYRNGMRTLLLVSVGALTALLVEALGEGLLRRRLTVWDGSALIEGAIFAMLFPVTAPLWFVVIGAAVGAILFKLLWGGQGHCPIYPPVGAYALLYPFFRAFPVTYAAFGEKPDLFSVAPTGSVSESVADRLFGGSVPNDQMLLDLFLGRLEGSMGQLSILLLILSAVYLIARRQARTSQILFTILAFFALSLLLPPLEPASDAMAVRYAGMWLGSGTTVFLAVFAATHPTTAPRTMRGGILCGVCFGALTALLRYFGFAYDGAAHALLALQLLTPLINLGLQGRRYGATD